jgi:hypothetical protein
LLRFDPDSLSPADWETVELIDREPAGPAGLSWTPDATTLQKLAAWASWGVFLAELGVWPPEDQS